MRMSLRLRLDVFYDRLCTLAVDQNAVARTVNMTSGGLSRIVTGHRNASPAKAVAIADALGVRLWDLWHRPDFTGIAIMRENVSRYGGTRRPRYAPIIPPEEDQS